MGRDLFGKTDLQTYIADAMFKYRGLGSYIEFIKRDAQNPIISNPETGKRFVYSGRGFNSQLSFQFRNHLELAGRYSVITPNVKVKAIAEEVKEYTLATTYNYRWHRNKVMGDLPYQERDFFIRTKRQIRFVVIAVSGRVRYLMGTSLMFQVVFGRFWMRQW